MRAGRSGRAALVLVAAVVTLAGCGASGDDTPGERTEPADIMGVGLVRAGSTAQFANCADWRRGTPEERYATIEDIRGQLTPQSAETAESDLSDDAAYRIFQHTCQPEFSSKLRLYKLYARAQAFAPLTADQ